MLYSPLSAVRNRIRLGVPLPFNIRSKDYRLLLARGQVIHEEAQLNALFDYGALVDLEDLRSPRELVNSAPPEALPGLWGDYIDRMGRVLRTAEPRELAEALDEATEPVLALVERDPDLAIFQVVRQDTPSHLSYGVSHSVHAAIACHLVAGRLGWSGAEVRCLFKAALTMNLSMVELQGRLAQQTTPLTPEQRQAIHDHPTRSVEMLEAAGVTDADWLGAVRDHHEAPNGSGYPRGVSSVSEMAAMLRRVDIYTARLSPRATRPAVAAHEAARDLFVNDGQHPMAAALIKEFGLYPPGCLVMLESGEMGVVIRRGPSAHAPVVAALTSRLGDALVEPLRRFTHNPGLAVTKVLPDSALRVRVSPEKLAVLAAR